ncbi:hypothetical protein [Streptomyces sp. NPDC057428]|uniref:hypothetical protein n=1 Tax=Streptomyces sp. NPDC057428 TaxID=3346129 RepID=UPI0036BB11A4
MPHAVWARSPARRSRGTAQAADVRLYHANTVTYDLTIGSLHTYYVEAGNTPVLVHNCNESSTADPTHLQARVDAATKKLGAGARWKTVGGLHVPEGDGLDLFAVGARSEFTDAQIALTDEEDEAFRMYPRLPKKTDAPLILGHNHAEEMLLTEAVNLRVTPQLLIASNASVMSLVRR